jgi:hypothetical protein
VARFCSCFPGHFFICKLFNMAKYPQILGNTGNVRFNTRFGNTATLLLKGNVSLTLDGMVNGETAMIVVTQDGTGGRALTINAVPGTTNKVTSTAGISTVANVSTVVVISRYNGINNIIYQLLDGSGSSGGGGGTGTVNSVNTKTPNGAGAVTIDGTNINSDGVNSAGSTSTNTIQSWLTDYGTRINTAKSVADTAASNATTASSNATSALSTANSASTTAGNALTAANSANTTAGTANTTANNASAAAGTAQTTANNAALSATAAAAGNPSALQIVGQTYNVSSWANLSDFSTNTLGATISANKISVPNAGVSDFTKSLQLSAYSCINKWKLEMEFQLTQTPAAGTTGISLGIQGQNANSLNSLAVYFRCVNDSNLGRMEFFSQSNGGNWINNPGGTLISAQSNLSFVANDNIRLSMERVNQNIIMRAENRSNPAVAPVTFTYVLPYAANPIPPNTGRFAIWGQGGTFTINRITVTNKETKNPSVLLIGDSKTMGYGASNFYTTYPGILGRHVYNQAIAAGFGDKTADVLNRMPEILAIAPKTAVLSIGSNDARFGVSNGTFQANYASIVTQLTNAGVNVVHLSPSFETSLDLTAQYTYVTTTYGASVVDVFYTSRESGNLYSDNIHWSDTMNRAAAEALVSSGLLKGLKSTQDYYSTPIDIDREDLTTTQTDAQLNAVYAWMPLWSRIIAVNTSGGGIIYEKRKYNVWMRIGLLS